MDESESWMGYLIKLPSYHFLFILLVLHLIRTKLHLQVCLYYSKVCRLYSPLCPSSTFMHRIDSNDKQTQRQGRQCYGL